MLASDGSVGSERSTLDALSRLLGEESKEEGGEEPRGADEAAAPPPLEPQRTTTAAPPRREASSGSFASDGWNARVAAQPSGEPTELGEALSVPTVEPVLWRYVLVLNLLVYAGGVGAEVALGEGAAERYFLFLAEVPERVAGGEFYRLLTAPTLHAGLGHLALNSVALAQLAPEVEAVFGRGRFGALYALTGAAGSVGGFLVSDAATVGASGAVYGLLGALLAYFARNRDVANAGFQALVLVAAGGASLWTGVTDPAVDDAGHVFGLIAGLWLGWAAGPRLGVTREVKLDPGALEVPEDAEEVAVVVDTSTLSSQLVVYASFALSLAVGVAAGVAARTG